MFTSLPAGYFLAWLCKDELVDGRKWFRIILACLFIVLVLLLISYRNLNCIFAVIYMIIVTSIALWKGEDKKFLRR
jgi:amino acid permease